MLIGFQFPHRYIHLYYVHNQPTNNIQNCLFVFQHTTKHILLLSVQCVLMVPKWAKMLKRTIKRKHQIEMITHYEWWSVIEHRAAYIVVPFSILFHFNFLLFFFFNHIRVFFVHCSFIYKCLLLFKRNEAISLEIAIAIAIATATQL